ncbi:hypothetical protein FPV67DRAFT_1420894 [Lyophyllum atratum]|nr:hypothetical protein FPV67DRAFT_1420894 [Lyophyllum atratum]
MLSLVLIHALLARNANSAPVLPAIPQYAESPSDDSKIYRTTAGIVWNCLITIFLCTWVAIHPNVPAPEEGWFNISLLRFKTMIYALLAPELMMWWAARQWLGAEQLVGTTEFCDWTKTHGFFAQMGGFMLYDKDKKPIGVLLPKELLRRLRDEEVKSPRISEREIQDRSKGDAVSKGIVLLQTSAFFAQCVARKVEGLAITELELVTLGYTFLNCFIYYLWWNKPQNVQCVVPVYLKKVNMIQLFEGSHASDEDAQEQIDSSETKYIDPVDIDMEPLLAISQTAPPHVPTPSPYGIPESITYIINILSSAPHAVQTTLPGTRASIRRFGWRLLNMLRSAASCVTSALISTVADMGGACGHIHPDDMKVPAFYAMEPLPGSIHRYRAARISAFSIGAIFGAIHCFAWSFHFPTAAEKLVWRGSSVVITGFPVIDIVSHIFFMILRTERFRHLANKDGEGRITYATFFFVGAIIYLVARIVLLVLPLLALRDIPPDAYIAVQWASLIPHLG